MLKNMKWFCDILAELSCQKKGDASSVRNCKRKCKICKNLQKM